MGELALRSGHTGSTNRRMLSSDRAAGTEPSPPNQSKDKVEDGEWRDYERPEALAVTNFDVHMRTSKM